MPLRRESILLWRVMQVASNLTLVRYHRIRSGQILFVLWFRRSIPIRNIFTGIFRISTFLSHLILIFSVAFSLGIRSSLLT